MYALKSNDVKTWDFLSENFSVNKSNVPFCALGTDHALEQENKNMKVLGGITGITNCENDDSTDQTVHSGDSETDSDSYIEQ